MVVCLDEADTIAAEVGIRFPYANLAEVITRLRHHADSR
jgi:hypothetical protein